jgi:hypothetical protein
MSAWFRFYESALDDPKVQKLPGDLATWRNWCRRAAEQLGRPAPAPAGAAAAVAGKFFVKADTPQWEAWSKHLLAAGRSRPPTNRAGGWWFDSEWPPDRDQQQDAA